MAKKTTKPLKATPAMAPPQPAIPGSTGRKPKGPKLGAKILKTRPATPKTNKLKTAKPKPKTAKFKTAKPTRASTALPPATAPHATAAVLDRLFDVVLQRRTADPTLSHSARLLARGSAKVAQKFGEEAVECLIEAVAGNREALVAESADVLYHLLVMWVAADLTPNQVWAELERREGVSGVAEKASRPRPAVGTTKIP